MTRKHADSTLVAGKLRSAGLRPTAQRMALGRLLFGHDDRHVCAETIHTEARANRVNVSLATVYNTLNQMTAAGLLREIGIDGNRRYFDTNTSNHFHLLDEETGDLVDIDAGAITLQGLPNLPKGKEISRIDVVVRLRPKSS